MQRTLYTDMIRSAADAHGLDPDLVEAVVIKESSGNSWAWNPEPKYRYLWDVRTGKPFRALSGTEIASETPPPDFPTLAGDRDQEWWGQTASWGLMQTMGSVARERGFTGAFLTALCEPQTGLRYGCLHLAHLLSWAKGDRSKALSAYNAGFAPSAQGAAYATAVLRIYDQLTHS